MFKKLVSASLVIISCAVTVHSAMAKPLSDLQIKQRIIQESIAEYPSNCPCPYNTARNGSSCGRRSAYSRPGGYAPICYQQDVTPQMIKAYRASH